jgi:exosortase family protein XrtM
MNFLSQLRFGALFLGLFVLFQAGYYLLPDSALHLVVQHLVVEVAAGTINFFSPDQAVTAHGQRLLSSRAALEVIRGCDGSGAAFMLVSAVVAFGATSWRRLLAGVLGAAALMYVLNQLRIVALYYVLAAAPARFDDVHEYVAPLLLIIVSSAAFLLWALHGSGTVSPPDEAAPATAGEAGGSGEASAQAREATSSRGSSQAGRRASPRPRGRR